MRQNRNKPLANARLDARKQIGPFLRFVSQLSKMFKFLTQPRLVVNPCVLDGPLRFDAPRPTDEQRRLGACPRNRILLDDD
jgi:hypothetical protein